MATPPLPLSKKENRNAWIGCLTYWAITLAIAFEFGWL